MGKKEIARDEQFLFFPTVFSKNLYRRHVKTRACLRKGLTITPHNILSKPVGAFARYWRRNDRRLKKSNNPIEITTCIINLLRKNVCRAGNRNQQSQVLLVPG